MLKLRWLRFLLLSMMVSPAFAYDYDPLLMRAQASIFPKIILLDKNLGEKVDKDTVVISILYGEGEQGDADKVRQLIQEQYKSNLGMQTLKINLVKFDEFDDATVATAYFLLKGEKQHRNKVTRHAAKQQRLVFSYDYKDFEGNALVSMLMKEKTYIYLNKSAIHDYDIKFLPLFYKIVKVIE